jgi:hypothetical protein
VLRARLLGVALVGVGLLTGCYGSTEPATNVGIDSATLNGHGTADNGRAHSYFEYWLPGSENLGRVGDHDWPAGASGPITDKVVGLAANSTYNFRLCGADVTSEGSGPTACAQTLSFKTKPPVEDSLKGHMNAGCCSGLVVDAKSAPNGSNPRGSIFSHRQSSMLPPPGYDFSGIVTCLAVNGSRAAVGAVGKWTHGDDPPTDGTFLVTIVDGRAQEDTYNEVQTSGSTPPNCATADFSHQSPLIIREYSFIVNDAQ